MTPALVISGTSSGVGKTSVALGICRALARRGVRIGPAKVGPDYLDPTYLSLAAGRACSNFDPWMMGESAVRRAAAAIDADFLLIEGVMGLYDGADADSDDGSTAHVARLLEAPVWLVVDARGVGRSFAATVQGFVNFPGAPRITGIVANRCGSERHAAMLREALLSVGLPKLVGAIPRNALPGLARQHLGLVAASNESIPEPTLNALADSVELHLELPTATIRHRAPHPPAFPDARSRLAVAWDAAFSFAYADLWRALEERGIAPVRFSPLADSAVPSADGLFLPGGYPEAHAERLTDNHRMLDSVRAFAATGRPIYAECGGLMYLSAGIALADGRRLPMAGVLPSWTRMLPHHRTLGYAEVSLREDTCLGRAGDKLRGHEFHYSELETEPAGWTPVYQVAYRRGTSAREGWKRGAILASYIHLHLPSHPASLLALATHLGHSAC